MSETTPKSISPHELYDLRTQQPVRVVDVRFPKAFEKVRAKKTVNIPLYRVSPETLAKEIAPEETLYIICKNGSVGRRLVRTYGDLFRSQNRELVFVEGGVKAWEKSGLPTFRKESIWSRPDIQCRFLAWSSILILLLLAIVLGQPGYLGLASFVMAGIVFFSTISEATPLTNLLERMPWNTEWVEEPEPKSPTEETPKTEDLSQQASSHEVT